jgi:hypothetical protein
MKRRESLILLSGGLGAAVISVASRSSGGEVSIPVFAHYMDWASAADVHGWSVAGILPEAYPKGYDSKDPAAIAYFNALMEVNGILPMVSWWARDTYAGDAFLDVYLDMPGPQLGILYEAIGPGRMQADANGNIDLNDPKNSEIFISDMQHLQEKYFSRYSDRFFRIDGRPVVFIWISHAFTGQFEPIVAAARQNASFYLVGSEFTAPWAMAQGHETVLRAMDAISAYGFFDTKRYNSQMNLQSLADYRQAVYRWSDWLAENSSHTKLLLPMSFSYDERKLPNRNGLYFMSSFEMARQFAELVRWLIETQCAASGRILPVSYITSFTEWFEGSAIAPSNKYGDGYLRIINDVFNVPRSALNLSCGSQ